ncbi:MAG: lipid-transfer protein [Acidimicrobiia bacterium]|nr:lipid-transfer protein [Acidimicrobiia bacterium]
MAATTAAIAGIGQTEFAKVIERPEVTLACEAAAAALADAGLAPADVDAMVRFDLETTQDIELARNLGVENLRFFADTPHGGGGGCATLGIAAAAVETGRADVVLCWRSRKRGSGRRPWATNDGAIAGEKQYWVPFGLARPVDQVAMMARRYMHEYGLTEVQLGHVACTIRAHAQRNPAATMTKDMDVATYLASRFVSEPLRVPDCCLESDGAVAVVVTSLERARDLPQAPVVLVSTAMGSGPQTVGMANYFGPSITTSPAAACATSLWERTDRRPADVDCAQLYDAFTPLVVQSLEEYGFCERGEGGVWAEAGELAWPSGRLPVNTSGGGLSEAYLHGFNLISEGVRQVRGTSTSQVPGASTVLVTSGNGVPTSAVLLGSDR